MVLSSVEYRIKKCSVSVKVGFFGVVLFLEKQIILMKKSFPVFQKWWEHAEEIMAMLHKNCTVIDCAQKKKLQNTETLTILKDGYISIYVCFHNHVLQYSALAHIEKLNSYFMGKVKNQISYKNKFRSCSRVNSLSQPWF